MRQTTQHNWGTSKYYFVKSVTNMFECSSKIEHRIYIPHLSFCLLSFRILNFISSTCEKGWSWHSIAIHPHPPHPTTCTSFFILCYLIASALRLHLRTSLNNKSFWFNYIPNEISRTNSSRSGASSCFFHYNGCAWISVWGCQSFNNIKERCNSRSNRTAQ